MSASSVVCQVHTDDGTAILRKQLGKRKRIEKEKEVAEVAATTASFLAVFAIHTHTQRQSSQVCTQTLCQSQFLSTSLLAFYFGCRGCISSRLEGGSFRHCQSESAFPLPFLSLSLLCFSSPFRKWPALNGPVAPISGEQQQLSVQRCRLRRSVHTMN